MLRDAKDTPYGMAEKQLLSQVLKVVQVWRDRKVYDEETLNELK